MIGGGRDAHRETCSERISKVQPCIWEFLGMAQLVLILI